MTDMNVLCNASLKSQATGSQKLFLLNCDGAMLLDLYHSVLPWEPDARDIHSLSTISCFLYSYVVPKMVGLVPNFSLLAVCLLHT